MTTSLTSLAPALIEATLRPSLTLVIVVACLVATGTSLLLDRSLVRVLLGLLLIGNGIAVLFMVVSGTAGAPAFVGSAPASEMSDPLPQAMVLTAIVISLATIGFLLALAYRLWQISAPTTFPTTPRTPASSGSPRPARPRRPTTRRRSRRRPPTSGRATTPTTLTTTGSRSRTRLWRGDGDDRDRDAQPGADAGSAAPARSGSDPRVPALGPTAAHDEHHRAEPGRRRGRQC